MRFVATAMLLCSLATTARTEAPTSQFARDAPENTPSRDAPANMASLDAATAPCAAKAPIDGEAIPCKRVEDGKLDGLGAVSVSQWGSLDKKWDGIIGYQLAFEHAGSTWVSHFFRFLVTDCYHHGLCTSVVRVTEKLRAIDLGGTPAAALEIHVRRRHTNDDPHYDYTIDATRFLVCGFASTDAPRCTSIEVADECHPSLDRHGTVSYRCPTWVGLSLDHP